MRTRAEARAYIPPAAEMPVNGHKSSLTPSRRHAGSDSGRSIANDCPGRNADLKAGQTVDMKGDGGRGLRQARFG